MERAIRSSALVLAAVEERLLVFESECQRFTQEGSTKQRTAMFVAAQCEQKKTGARPVFAIR
jgi:hypothetical protein